MPPVRTDVVEGPTRDELKRVFDQTHLVMVEAFEVLLRDFYQQVHKAIYVGGATMSNGKVA